MMLQTLTEASELKHYSHYEGSWSEICYEHSFITVVDCTLSSYDTILKDVFLNICFIFILFFLLWSWLCTSVDTSESAAANHH